MWRTRALAGAIVLADALGIWFAISSGIEYRLVCVNAGVGSGGESGCFSRGSSWEPGALTYGIGAASVLSLSLALVWWLRRARSALIVSVLGAVVSAGPPVVFLAVAVLNDSGRYRLGLIG